MADHDAVRRLHGFHHLRVSVVVQETADTSVVLRVLDELADLSCGPWCSR